MAAIVSINSRIEVSNLTRVELLIHINSCNYVTRSVIIKVNVWYDMYSAPRHVL